MKHQSMTSRMRDARVGARCLVVLAGCGSEAPQQGTSPQQQI
jgi:hypothetical protein